MKFKSEYKSKFFKKRHQQFENKLSKTPNFPKNALIEVSNGCNHACVFCSNSLMLRKIGTLDLKLYKKFVIEGVKNGLNEIGLYSTGEPLITKNLEEYVSAAKSLGIKRVYITTNGSLASLEKVKRLKEKGVDSIKFSINAATKASYKIIHGKDDFEKVLKNVDDIYKWKIKNKVELQLLATFVYTKLTKNEIEIFKKNLSYYFEDVWYLASTGQAGDNIENTKELSPYWEYDKDIKPCDMVFNRIHLTYEGYLTACCSDYENNLTFGNLNKENFNLLDEWQNDIIQRLREKHLNKKLDNLLCKSCLSGEKFDYKPISEFRGKDGKSSNPKFKNYKERLKLHNNLT
jgi:MoaA/NifB/PqqE/SkfB family radical SAM enzyme